MYLLLKHDNTKVHKELILNKIFQMQLCAFASSWQKFSFRGTQILLNAIRLLRSDYLPVGSILLIFLFSFMFVFKSCIVPYFPETTENEELLIVEGLITDQHETNIIKLHKSVPLWKIANQKPLTGCQVWISDDLGTIDSLKEISIGTYITDSATFQGKAGKKYTLHVNTPVANGGLNYESIPVEMKSVPQIDSIWYEKKIYITFPRPIEGCQIYVNTHNPANESNFYKWNYSETWEFHLPFEVENKVCWISGNSNEIFIKNASILNEGRVIGFPLNSIHDPIDKLSVKYSILVRQYSLNEDEYLYWERLKNTLEQMGGLYDIVPAIIPNNVYCIENPNEKTLGYFSVSAVTTKRAFIKDHFSAYNFKYVDCISDSIIGTGPVPGGAWVIIDHSNLSPPVRYITRTKDCADCTSRGTNIKPSFWDDDKK